MSAIEGMLWLDTMEGFAQISQMTRIQVDENLRASARSAGNNPENPAADRNQRITALILLAQIHLPHNTVLIPTFAPV